MLYLNASIRPVLAFCDSHRLHLVSLRSFICFSPLNHKENGLTEVCRELVAFPAGIIWGTHSVTHYGEGKTFLLPRSQLKGFGCFQPEKLPLDFPWKLQYDIQGMQNYVFILAITLKELKHRSRQGKQTE